MGILPLPQGLLLGSIVAATDPIAVIAVFQRLHVPRDLVTLVEGESLFNDGTAVVLYATLVASFASHAGITFGGMTSQALVVTFGGAAIGFVGALLAALILRGVDNPMLHIVASIVAAYGTYLAADHYHVSGIFAVLATGVSLRAFEHFPHGEESTREVDRFWSVLAFLANSFVFLLLGLRIDPARMFHEPKLILAVLACVVGTRLALSYGLLRFALPSARRTARQHIIAIAGMRGALSLALALMLPESMPHRAEIIDAVFAVVTVTLVAQGLAIAPIVRRLAL
jgi:CPA1 family monovalent cation:H+ antiporter